MRRVDAAARRKLRARGGFTLIELLVTVLLVTLVGGVVSATVGLSARQMRLRTQDSDAQLLCSSLSLFVQNELTYAGDIVTEGGEIRSFTDHVRGLGAGCSFVNENGRLVVRYPYGDGCADYEAVGGGAYKGRNALTEEHMIHYDDGTAEVTIRVLAKDGTVLAENFFRVRPIAP